MTSKLRYASADDMARQSQLSDGLLLARGIVLAATLVLAVSFYEGQSDRASDPSTTMTTARSQSPKSITEMQHQGSASVGVAPSNPQGEIPPETQVDPPAPNAPPDASKE